MCGILFSAFGACTVPLPKYMLNRCRGAILNIRNKDKKCFLYCIAASRFFKSRITNRSNVLKNISYESYENPQRYRNGIQNINLGGNYILYIF
jgi:hypothetical protein